MRLNSVRDRLVLLFFAITTAAVGFVYLYVVPQLRSSLTAEKLSRLEQVGGEQSQVLAAAMQKGASQAEIRRLVRTAAQRADARVTILGLRPGPAGPEPAFVVADSEMERTAVAPSYPAAGAAAATGRTASSVERVDGERLGETAIGLSRGGEPAWVAVLSTPLAEVDDNVALISRQILIAGAIAIVAALGRGHWPRGRIRDGCAASRRRPRRSPRETSRPRSRSIPRTRSVSWRRPSTRCRSGWRGWRAPAASSSPTPPTSCARRSSRSAASSSCSRRRIPIPRRGPSSCARCGSRSGG